MTAFLIALGITAAVLLAVVCHILGALVGQRKGFADGFRIAVDYYEQEEDADDAYLQHYGGLIDAGRRRDN